MRADCTNNYNVNDWLRQARGGKKKINPRVQQTDRSAEVPSDSISSIMLRISYVHPSTLATPIYGGKISQTNAQVDMRF